MDKYLMSWVLVFCVACSSSTNTLKDFSEYRSSPFQWVYPEYFYKTEVINIENKGYVLDGQKNVDFWGLTVKVPVGYEKSKKEISDKTIVFKSRLFKKNIFFISLDDETIMLGSDFSIEKNKDYYSAFSSAEEYFNKLFTLTPDMISETTSTGDLWLIHAKGMLFEFVRKIEIYKGENFVAYVRFYKKDYPYLETEIVIFHDCLPKHKFITMGFKNVDLDVGQFLSTLKEVK